MKNIITVMLLICCTALVLQCTEGADKRKLRGVLEHRLRHCRRSVLLSPCKFLLNNNVQADDQSLKKCCKKVGSAKVGQDCFCLLREVGRVTPSSEVNSYDKKTLQLLEAVSSNKQLLSSCAALNGVEDNCSGVAKAIRREAEIQKMTLQEDFTMSSQCDKAALNLKDVCGSTVVKARSGSGVDSKRKAESAVCCYELERFRGSNCACSLGSTVSTSKDILDFLAEVDAVGKTLSAGCHGFNVDVKEFCPKPTNQGDKKPLLFDKCETTAQEAVKTCAPMIKEATASFKKTKPISDADKETINCCAAQFLGRTSMMFDEDQPTRCFCNMTVYEEFQKASEADKKAAANNPQTVSCCKQLSKLIESPPQSCFCNITHHKSVTSRATTTEFLTADIIHEAVEKNCDPEIFLSNYHCVVQTPYVDTPIDNSLWGVLGRWFRGEVPDKLCYPGMKGPRGC